MRWTRDTHAKSGFRFGAWLPRVCARVSGTVLVQSMPQETRTVPGTCAQTRRSQAPAHVARAGLLALVALLALACRQDMHDQSLRSLTVAEVPH